ncbi:MAG: glycosyltransferase family 87 protein [Planctomycetota bacterium]|jgi:hypothetical protein
MRRLPDRLLRFAALSLVCALAAAALARGVSGAVGGEIASKDFKWDAARLLLMRLNPLEYTIEGKPAPTDEFMPDRLGAQEVPSAFMLILPYAFLPWPAARFLWLITNLVCTYLLLRFAFHLFAPGRSRGFYVVVAALFVAGTPWRNGITLGQHTIFSLAFFTMALWYAGRGKKDLAGVLLAFSLLKYTVTLPLLLFFLYRKYYRPVLVAFGIHLVLNLVAAAWLSVWPHVLVAQSLRASFSLAAEGYLDFKSLFVHLKLAEPPMLVGALQAATVAAAVVLSLRHRAGRDLLLLSALGMLSLVMVYHRPYDFVLLLFPLILVSRDRWGPFTRPLAACIALVFYVNSAVRVLDRVLPGGPDILASRGYYLFVALCWYATLAGALFTLARPGEVTAATDGTSEQ